MAADPQHMRFVFLRRLAMSRAAFALLAGADEQEPVLKVMNAEPGCRDAGGLTPGQEASMLAAIHDAPFSAQAAADAVSDIIAANHSDDELAVSAARIDLIDALRRIEQSTRLDDERTVALLRSKCPEAKAAAAAQAIFQLREIGRMVAPLVALLDTHAHDAGQSYPEAAE